MKLSPRGGWFENVARLIGRDVTPDIQDATRLIDEILEQRSYWPVFQPIRDLDSNLVVGYESLTRFEATQTPQRLFAHARLVGRGRDLEVATMQAAVKAAAELPAQAWLSVNASADLLSETDTLAAILEPLDRPTVIELSDHEQVADSKPLADALKRLGPGRSLAVDDASFGFASLRRIVEVRPAYVKMEIGLVQGAATDLARRAMVAGFVHFAHEADVTLVAVGIQDEDDLETLKDLDVSLGQGYLLGRPERVAFLEDQPITASSTGRRVWRASGSAQRP